MLAPARPLSYLMAIINSIQTIKSRTLKCRLYNKRNLVSMRRILTTSFAAWTASILPTKWEDKGYREWQIDVKTISFRNRHACNIRYKSNLKLSIFMVCIIFYCFLSIKGFSSPSHAPESEITNVTRVATWVSKPGSLLQL